MRADDGFADRGSISRIVLTAFAGEAVRRDELGGDRPHNMAILLEKTRPVVCAETGCHTYQTGW